MTQSVRLASEPPVWWRASRPVGLALVLIALALALPATASAFASAGDGNWVRQSPNPQGNFLFDVTFFDASHGWAVGERGTILATSDGGATWRPQSSGINARLDAVAFISTSHGWAVGASYDSATGIWTGVILATTDGGASWSLQSQETNARLIDVAFADASHGWAVGKAGMILATTNGGSIWSAQSSETSEELSAVDFVDASHGWAVGNGGTVLATTDGGAAWNARPSGTTLPLIAVTFVDATHGWAVGLFGATILATTDGAASWIASSVSSGWLSGVAFADVKHGWAVGEAGVILATADGGASWARQISGSDAYLSAVAFTDVTHGWAVGSDGTILATSDGGVTWSARSAGLGVAAPTFTAASTVFVDSLVVGIDCATPGATVRYTTDGSDPTASSAQYAGPLSLTTTTDLAAKAFKDGYTESAVTRTKYYRDRDGDALADEWETEGVNTDDDDAIEVDLPAMGADPLRKDVFVQINWMQEPASIDRDGKLIEGDHHKPKPEALAKVIKAFKDAPIDNPDGSRGITLHIDAGADSVMTPSGDKWGTLSEARPVPVVTGITEKNVWAKFDKEWNYWAGVPYRMPSRDRDQAFHYCLFASSFYTSGAARDHNVVGAPGGDFIVGDGYDGGSLSITEQAGTFMHELGHNFGLNHGGNQEVHYKPNYLSVMNYSFQMSGLLKGGKFGTIDYSGQTLYPLNEMSLDEAEGIGPKDRVGDYGTVYWRNGTGQPGDWGLATEVPYRVSSLSGAIDWNGSGGDRESSVSVDLNTGWNSGDAKPDEVLAGSRDWGPSLQFGGGPSHRIGPPITAGSGASMASTAGTPVDPEPSYADFVAAGLVLRDYRVAVTAEDGNVVMAKLGAGGLSIALKVTNEGLEPDTYRLQAWGLGGASLGNVLASVQLSADASQTVNVPVALPTGTPSGLVGSVRLLTTSTGSPEISDEVEVAVYVESPAPTVTLKLTGLKGGAVKRGGVVTATGAVTPLSLTGGKVTLSVQRKTGATWVKMKTTFARISPKGKYTWKHKPAKKGTYRIRATIAKTATLVAAKTAWRGFRVK